MASRPRRDPRSATVSLAELSVDLAQLDLHDVSSLAKRILEVIAANLNTDRVCLSIIEAGAPPKFSKVYSLGFELRRREWHKSTKVIMKACQSKKPQIIHDIREHPDLVSPWPDNYATDASVTLPLVHANRVWAVVCISNLSRQQLIMLENSPAELTLIATHLCKLVNLLVKQAPK